MRRLHRSGRISPAILVLLLAALAVGASASLLAGAASRSNASPQHFAEVTAQPWILEAALFVLIFGALALLVYHHTQGRTPVPGRLAVTAFVGILLAVLLFVVFHNLAFPPAPSNNTTAPGSGDSGSGPPPDGGGAGPGGSGSLYYLGPAVPPWSLFLIVGVAAVIIAVVVTMPAWRRAIVSFRSRRAQDTSEETVDQVRGALADAGLALEAGIDPRQVVIRLYGDLLVRLRPLVSDLDRSTPEEIRWDHLTRLGVRPSAAEVLTRSFEEARYSSHPVTEETVDEVRAAIHDALVDLDRP